MADSSVQVTATIAAEDTWSDDLLLPTLSGLQQFRADVLGSSTFNTGSIVTIQGKAHGDADADFMDLAQIEPADEAQSLIGDVSGGMAIRIGIKTGEFQAGDSLSVRLTKV